jgi:thiol-disulfide isomerase/thioredoxin
MRRISLIAFLGLVLSVLVHSPPAFADRQKAFVVRQEDGSYCEEDILVEMKKVKGVKKYRFDRASLELRVTMAEGVSDQVVLDAIKRARARCSMEMGDAHGAPSTYSKNADVKVLSKKGESIGSLKRHLVPGKYTVFDVYADWCAPCQRVDRKLREITATRQDVAVRKLNIVDFNTPLVRELGPKLKALPYLVVFDPKGKRTDIIGGSTDQLAATLRVR